MSDAASRALVISELQAAILEKLDKCSQARCARVCKAWTDTSIEHVWRELDSVTPLLKLLGDSSRQSYAQRAPSLHLPVRNYGRRGSRQLVRTVECPQPPTEQHWDKFASYARLVTKLRVSNDDYIGGLRDIPKNDRGTKFLLPNLLSLHVHVSIGLPTPLVATLLSSSLKSLDLVIDIKAYEPSGMWKHLATFLDKVIEMSHQLECFGIKVTPGSDSSWSGASQYRFQELEDVILAFLARLPPCLTTIRANSTMFTPKLFQLLSTFPHLESIRNSGRRLYYTPTQLQISSPTPDGAFSALKEMFIPAMAKSLGSILRNLRPILGTLTTLTIGCRDHATPQICHGIFAAISESFPMLTSLEVIACTSLNEVGGKLNTTEDWRRETCSPDSRELRQRYLSLNSIFALLYLRRLTLVLDHILPIDDNGLEQALQSRKVPFDILQLSWTPRRLDLEKPHLTLRALDIVAQYSPTIRILSLLLRIEHGYQQPSQSHSFTSLEEMNFGLSSLPPDSAVIRKVAKRLSELFWKNNTGIPEISASRHTGNFEKCQFSIPTWMGRVKAWNKEWRGVLSVLYVLRGGGGDRKSLRRFARSEGRIVYRRSLDG